MILALRLMCPTGCVRFAVARAQRSSAGLVQAVGSLASVATPLVVPTCSFMPCRLRLHPHMVSSKPAIQEPRRTYEATALVKMRQYWCQITSTILVAAHHQYRRSLNTSSIQHRVANGCLRKTSQSFTHLFLVSTHSGVMAVPTTRLVLRPVVGVSANNSVERTQTRCAACAAYLKH